MKREGPIELTIECIALNNRLASLPESALEFVLVISTFTAFKANMRLQSVFLFAAAFFLVCSTYRLNRRLERGNFADHWANKEDPGRDFHHQFGEVLKNNLPLNYSLEIVRGLTMILCYHALTPLYQTSSILVKKNPCSLELNDTFN